MRYETLGLLSPVLDKRNIDTGLFHWRRVGVYNVYQQFPRGGRYRTPGAYGRYGICPAPVPDRSRLFYPVSLCFPVLHFPQTEGGKTQACTFSAEFGFVPGYCSGDDSVNDITVQLGN